MQQLWVVAGLLFDATGRVLIAQRPAGKVLAGRWEFPGGKIATGEGAHDAVVRELHEELGVTVRRAARQMCYAATYPRRIVWLDVWRVDEWSGEPQGLDGQALAWVACSDLHRHDILEADAPIIAFLASSACGIGHAPERVCDSHGASGVAGTTSRAANPQPSKPRQ